jgi:hypothetical protein
VRRGVLEGFSFFTAKGAKGRKDFKKRIVKKGRWKLIQIPEKHPYEN